MGSYIWYFVVTIGVLVFIHEFGHFIAAKLMKMRVEVFSLGFGFRLLGWNKITGLTFGNLPKDLDLEDDTDYRISIVPLGGYVKIAGMVDENLDTKNLSSEPKPWEYRAKKPLAKIFVISAGVLMNLLLAYFVFFYNNAFVGKLVLQDTKIGKIYQESAAYGTGLQENDQILAVNGIKVNNWEQLLKHIFITTQGSDLELEVKRNNEQLTIKIPRNKIPADPTKKLFIIPANMKPIVANVLENSPASKAGLKPGDIIISINDTIITSSQQTVAMISSKINKLVNIKIAREKDTLIISPTTNSEGKIGIAINEIYTGPTEYLKYGIFESIIKGAENIVEYTYLTFNMLGKVVRGNIKFENAFGGPIKIAQFATKSAESGFNSFLNFLALLSLSLAIINILPIPALDGGHLIIEIIEAIIKREIPIKTKIVIQNVGMGLLLLLMAFVIYSDIVTTFFRK